VGSRGGKTELGAEGALWKTHQCYSRNVRLGIRYLSRKEGKGRNVSSRRGHGLRMRV
jgi:hypothetical protein